MSKEARKLALEALEEQVRMANGWQSPAEAKAIAALREALAEQSNLKQVIELYDSPDQPAPVAKPHEQEPVAHQYQSKDGVWRDFISQSHYKATVEDGSWPIRALYTFPLAQRTWVGLTNDEVNNLAAGCHLGNSVQDAIYKAAAKLKEKNNG